MQPVPEGYEPLDLVGFTDRGIWSNTETYIKNDIVHKDNIAWRCLIDDTTGITPALDNNNWELFVDSTTPFYGAYATFPEVGEPGRFYVDDTVDPRLMYTWDSETEKYILTGGAGGADGGSVDIPLTLPAANWTGTTAPYSQTATVPQMRVGMTPLVTLTDADDLTDGQRYAYSLLTDYDTAYASMTFYAADLPAVDIPVTLKGIPAQEMEFADNTVVLIVEPSGFTLSEDPEYDGRYTSTIPCEGMSEGAEGGSWDIVRSGKVLSLEESEIAAHITDVKCLDGAVMIVCTEPPAQRYLLKLSGTYKDAAPGDAILPNLLDWMENINSIMFTPVAYRNNFRDTYLGDAFTDEQKYVTAQDKFTGMNVGSYWVINGIRYRIADISYWIGTGDTECVTPHLVIVPDQILATGVMNDTNTTSGGYTNSKMYLVGTTPSIISIINSAFGESSILSHRELLTSAVSNGVPSAGTWSTISAVLMNEPMVYGNYCMTPANNGITVPYRATIDISQLALFALCPKFIIGKTASGEHTNYWLRDVVTASVFAYVGSSGNPDHGPASSILGVRPAFGIKGD